MFTNLLDNGDIVMNLHWFWKLVLFFSLWFLIGCASARVVDIEEVITLDIQTTADGNYVITELQGPDPMYVSVNTPSDLQLECSIHFTMVKDATNERGYGYSSVLCVQGEPHENPYVNVDWLEDITIPGFTNCYSFRLNVAEGRMGFGFSDTLCV